jgi:hypothetical protein
MKRNCQYWDIDVSQHRKKRRPLTQAPIFPEGNVADVITGSVDYSKFTVPQLRNETKAKRIDQRGLSKLKKSEQLFLLENCS